MEFISQDSKETAKEAMREAKRVDVFAPNMIINQTILNHYHNVRMDDRDQQSSLMILHQELGGTVVKGKEAVNIHDEDKVGDKI